MRNQARTQFPSVLLNTADVEELKRQLVKAQPVEAQTGTPYGQFEPTTKRIIASFQ